MAIPAIAWTMIAMLLKWASPLAREALSGGIRGYYKKAKESPNQADDVLAGILVALLQVDVSGVVIEPKPDTNTVPIPPDMIDLFVKSVVHAATGNPVGWTADRPFESSLDTGP